MRYAPLLLSFALVALPLAAQDSARVVTAERLLAPARGEWLSYGRDYANTRYSPLTQVNAATVGRLAPMALYQLGAKPGGLEASPIIADGVMYVSTSFDHVFAFDLRTRAPKWAYEHKLAQSAYCCGPVNRGVAIAHGLVYLATLDARLIALDAATGKVKWDVTTHAADSGYSHTMAPLVIGDRVIVGSAGGEYGIRGSVSAYDAHSGALLWRWFSIPSPEDGGWWGTWKTRTPSGDDLHRDIAREKADSARYADAWKRGGGPVWTTPAYDAELGLLYAGVGNPSPSNDGEVRPGDNLYTNSTVALDVKTGKVRWHYQHVAHDQWDYDIPNPPIVARIAGRKVVMHSTKTGWMYVFDAATGALIRRSDAFVPQENLFAVPTKDGVRSAPGPAGGANWPPSSYSPRTEMYYVSATHMPFLFRREPSEYKAGEAYIGGDYQPIEGVAPAGIIAALSPRTGRVMWSTKTDAWLWSGTLVTAGDLLFVGETNGWFRAYDARSGRKVWEFYCGAGVDAPPVSFELDGRQYIAVAAGGSRYDGLFGSTVLVFGLGGSQRETAAAAPPARAADAKTFEHAAGDRANAALPAGWTRVSPSIAYSSAERSVRIDLVAGMRGANRGLNFDGAYGGRRTITVPAGWSVHVAMRNADVAPHSTLLIAESDRLPAAPTEPIIAGAATGHLLDGLRTGASDTFDFVASSPGRYVIACGVPGHTPSGMYVRFVVAADAKEPSDTR